MPITAGGVTLSEMTGSRLTSLTRATKDALKKSHGLAWPGPGQTTQKGEARAVWFDPTHVMLIGPDPAAALEIAGAVTDQSDAWAHVVIEGDGIEDVLARLVAVDLRIEAFGVDQTMRTQIGHVSASLTRTGDNRIEILAFRSMAASLVHELEVAMKAVAARRAL